MKILQFFTFVLCLSSYQCIINKATHPDMFKYIKAVEKDADPFFKNLTLTEDVVKTLIKFRFCHLKDVHYDTGRSFDTPHYGLKNDKKYCTDSDAHKLIHPEVIYDNYYYVTDFDKQDLVKQIMQAYGFNTMAQISRWDQTRQYDFDLKATYLNSMISRFHHFHRWSTNFFCVFQSSNHIPGKWAITGKDLVIDNMNNYINEKSFANKEKCLETINFMPKTYRLWNTTECETFFSYLDSDQYKQNIKKNGIEFILKNGRDIHRGEGITLLVPDEQAKLQKKFSLGASCRIKKDVIQAQTYIVNPMLYKQKKIEVRIYFFIASVKPLIIYSQNNAHLRMCSQNYDPFDIRKESHVCNLAIANMGEQEKKDYVVDFSLDGMRDYLTEEGKLDNPNWVEEVVYPQIYQALIHLTRSGEHDFLRHSIVNENFAVDFLLDTDSKIHFMENNPNPQILATSEARKERHYKMFGDQLEIQFAYLRSRFKRLQQFSRKLLLEIQENDIPVKDSEKWNLLKAEFHEADNNKLEPEYQTRETNSYVKIYDENNTEDIFMGNLPDACIYKEIKTEEVEIDKEDL